MVDSENLHKLWLLELPVHEESVLGMHITDVAVLDILNSAESAEIKKEKLKDLTIKRGWMPLPPVERGIITDMLVVVASFLLGFCNKQS